MKTARELLMGCSLFALSVAAPGAMGQVLLDGDFNLLAVGTPPDCAAPAGAWEFPANYTAAALCEVLPHEVEIVATSSFDPAGSGNSLHLNASDPAGLVNIHVTNLFTAVIFETPGEIVTVTLDVWVPNIGVAGGSIYIGGDHGGGGFSNLSDRGPQISWTDLGEIVAWPGGIQQTLVPAYAAGQWQSIQIDIDLVTDTFDFSWGPLGGPLTPVASGVGFRSTPLGFLDRFSVAFYSASWATQELFMDNVAVTVATACVGDLDGDGDTDLADLGILLADFPCPTPANPLPCEGDLDGDGDTDLADLGILLADFPCP